MLDPEAIEGGIRRDGEQVLLTSHHRDHQVERVPVVPVEQRCRQGSRR
jgi:hypothetical protein